MKKIKWTRILALALTVMLLCLSITSCGSKKVPDASGTSGAMQWTYGSDSNTLTITGAGAMPDFENSKAVAWASVRDGVQKVVIGEGITTVGAYAFYGMPAMTEVVLPSTLTAVGNFAFAYCNKLAAVSIPTSVVSVGESAFEACGALTSVFVPASVTTLGNRAFAFCHALTSAVIAGDPATIGAWTFKNCKALTNLVLSERLTADRVDATAFEDAAKNFDRAERSTNPNGESTITVQYVTDGQTEVGISETKAYGEGYYYAVPVKNGYTADMSEVSGTANGADRVVTVTYTKNAPEESTEEPVVEEEEKNMTSIIIGIVIFVVVLIGIGVGAFLLMRSDKKAKKGKSVGKNAPTKKGKQK